MADFASRLVHRLVARSERVAFMKTRRNADGTLWFPGRLRARQKILPEHEINRAMARIEQLSCHVAGVRAVPVC